MDVSVTFEEGPVDYRAAHEAKHTGDVLHVSASPGDSDHFELRVYLDGDRLVLRCPGAPEAVCRSEGDGIEASYTFERPGTYEVFWIVGDSAIAGPVGSLDPDIQAAIVAGARVGAKAGIAWYLSGTTTMKFFYVYILYNKLKNFLYICVN